jgi:hypothetical protein
MNDLHTALHDLTEESRGAHVRAHDLWRAGRRVRRRERLLAAAAALAAVALLAGLGLVAQPLAEGPLLAAAPDVPDGGALPRSAYAPTYPASDWTFGDDRLEDDQTFGPVAIAQARGYLPPLLVGAVDGEHHLPDLPYVFDTPPMGESAVSVSPDGMLLAYAWRSLGAQTAQTTAGVALLDLRTGDVEQVHLRGRNDRPVSVDQISWSRDGSHVAWLGDEAVQWDTSGSGFKGPVLEVGVLRVGDGRIRTWTLERGDKGSSAVAAADTGEVYVLSRRNLWTYPADSPRDDDALVRHRAVMDSFTNWSGATFGDGRLYAGHSGGLVAIDPSDPR